MSAGVQLGPVVSTYLKCLIMMNFDFLSSVCQFVGVSSRSAGTARPSDVVVSFLLISSFSESVSALARATAPARRAKGEKRMTERAQGSVTGIKRHTEQMMALKPPSNDRGKRLTGGVGEAREVTLVVVSPLMGRGTGVAYRNIRRAGEQRQ